MTPLGSSDLNPRVAQTDSLSDPEPTFVLRAKDDLALEAIEMYRLQCMDYGLIDQAGEVAKAIDEIREWRLRNPDRCKLPDHTHQPIS